VSSTTAAIVGLGRMGRRHLQNLHDLNVRVVGAVDSRKDSLALAVDEKAVAAENAFLTTEEMLAKSRPELVIVATTAPGHAPITKQAAKAGVRFVLCEKPMACSLAECDEMIDDCHRHGTRLAINHQMRVMDQYVAIRDIVTAAEFGGLTSITVVAGNFGIAMNGTHYFELLRWLTNEQPHEVSAWFSPELVPNPRGPEFSDRGGSVRVITSGGRRLNLECGPEQGHGIRVVYAGRYGLAVADELAGTITVSTRDPADRNLPTTRYGTPSVTRLVNVSPGDALEPSRRVLEALLNGTDFPTGEDGRLAVATLAAAFVSHEANGRSVAVGSNLPRERRFEHA
jgi:predicted dehydrogenase